MGEMVIDMCACLYGFDVSSMFNSNFPSPLSFTDFVCMFL